MAKTPDTKALQARIPIPLSEAVARAAERLGMNESATVRELLTTSLRGLGLWPPPEAK